MSGDNDLKAVVATLSGTLASPNFPRGDLADLRRMSPESPPLVFWRVLNDYVPTVMRRSESAENRWLEIIGGMAIMAPSIHSFDPQYSVGAAFTLFPEQRLRHFLRSKGKNLSDQIRLLARLCASRGNHVDWYVLTLLLLSSGRKNEAKIKRDIAKDYIKIMEMKKEERSR